MYLFDLYFLNLNGFDFIGCKFFLFFVKFVFFLNICFGIGKKLFIIFLKDVFICGKMN